MIIKYVFDSFSIKSGCFYYEVAGEVETSFITSVAIGDQTQKVWPYDLPTSIIISDSILKVRFISDTMLVASRVEPLQYTRGIENRILLTDSLGKKNMVVAVAGNVEFSDEVSGEIIDPDAPVYGEFGKIEPPATEWTKDNGI